MNRGFSEARHGTVAAWGKPVGGMNKDSTAIAGLTEEGWATGLGGMNIQTSRGSRGFLEFQKISPLCEKRW